MGCFARLHAWVEPRKRGDPGIEAGLGVRIGGKGLSAGQFWDIRRILPLERALAEHGLDERFGGGERGVSRGRRPVCRVQRGLFIFRDGFERAEVAKVRFRAPDVVSECGRVPVLGGGRVEKRVDAVRGADGAEGVEGEGGQETAEFGGHGTEAEVGAEAGDGARG